MTNGNMYPGLASGLARSSMDRMGMEMRKEQYPWSAGASLMHGSEAEMQADHRRRFGNNKLSTSRVADSAGGNSIGFNAGSNEQDQLSQMQMIEKILNSYR